MYHSTTLYRGINIIRIWRNKVEVESSQVAVNLRMPRETWSFLRKQAFEQKISMNKIINHCIEKFKKSIEKKIEVK
jgi:hypothetical protein